MFNEVINEQKRRNELLETEVTSEQLLHRSISLLYDGQLRLSIVLYVL